MATTSDQTRLTIAEGRNDTQRDIAADKSYDARYLGLVEALGGKDSPWASASAAWNKEQQAKIAAVSKYRSAVNGGTASARIRALADLAKAVLKSESDLAKMGGSASPAVMDEVAKVTGIAFGDRPALANDRDKARLAWATFYRRAAGINGATLKATYDRMAEFYGSPNDAGLGPADGVEDVRLKVDARIKQTDDSIRRAYAGVQDITRKVDAGEQVPESELRNILQILPGLGDAGAISAFEKGLVDEKPPEKLDPLDQKRQDFLEGELGKLQKREEPVAEQPNEKHAWLASPKAQEWAKDNGLSVGYFLPVPVDAAEKAEFDKKYPNAVITKNGMYIQGPDDDKAAKIARRQLNTRPEAELFRQAGMGRNTGRKEGYVEFEVPGDPGGTKKHADGAWYFETGANGEKIYLDEQEVAARKPQVARVGQYPDGGVILALADGRYAWAADGDNFSIIDERAGQKIAARSGMVDVKPGQVEVPPGIDAGIQKTTTPPQGAVETVRGIKDRMRPTDPAGSVAIMTTQGRKVYQPTNGYRYVEGGEFKDTLGEKIAAARVRGAERREQARIGENADIGEKPSAAGVRERRDAVQEGRTGIAAEDEVSRTADRGLARAETELDRLRALQAAEPENETLAQRIRAAETRVADLRSVASASRPDGRDKIAVLPDAALNEDFSPRKSTDAAVEEYAQRARASSGLTNAQTRLVPGGKPVPVGTDANVQDLSLGDLAKLPKDRTVSGFPSTTRPDATATKKPGEVINAGGAEIEGQKGSTGTAPIEGGPASGKSTVFEPKPGAADQIQRDLVESPEGPPTVASPTVPTSTRDLWKKKKPEEAAAWTEGR